jgi:aldehyde:ferredoxin oxidoreductase
VTGGYVGRLLFVDLSSGQMHDEPLDERLCRRFIGGYGVGARIVYDRMGAGVDALGPENILGFMTGPLTGTAIFGSRYTVFAKSPLTHGWGDANSGGEFGPHLKFAGYDGVVFEGVSETPVYLYIENGSAELRDAREYWGKDTVETEDGLKRQLGPQTHVSCIGAAGEMMSRIACIINDHGRAAGRSGLGAVMGSKRLKAIAVNGNQKVPVAHRERLKAISKSYIKGMGPGADAWRMMGTTGIAADAAWTGGTPVKNWSGTAEEHFPHPERVSDASVLALTEKRYGCYSCPIRCSGYMKAGSEYDYPAGAKRPEYETLGAFGALCLNDNLESIVLANDICNRHGLDVISVGGIIAFAIECFETGAISIADTDGIELTWGNHRAIVAMTDKLARREGFGAVLADGIKLAAERIGKGTEEFAPHAGGQELAMWDPRNMPAYATSYQSDPTPGRHMQGGLTVVEGGYTPPGLELPELDKYVFTGKGRYEALIRNQTHLINSSGVCFFGRFYVPFNAWDELLSAVTGWDLTPVETNEMGERIAAMRQAFNVREGITPSDFKLKGRPIGEPPLKDGPNAGIRVEADTLVAEYFRAMRWDPTTGKPEREKLLELGLDDVAAVIYGEVVSA